MIDTEQGPLDPLAAKVDESLSDLSRSLKANHCLDLSFEVAAVAPVSAARGLSASVDVADDLELLVPALTAAEELEFTAVLTDLFMRSTRC